jgi:hypothetical protein
MSDLIDRHLCHGIELLGSKLGSAKRNSYYISGCWSFASSFSLKGFEGNIDWIGRWSLRRRYNTRLCSMGWGDDYARSFVTIIECTVPV